MDYYLGVHPSLGRPRDLRLSHCASDGGFKRGDGRTVLSGVVWFLDGLESGNEVRVSTALFLKILVFKHIIPRSRDLSED